MDATSSFKVAKDAILIQVVDSGAPVTDEVNVPVYFVKSTKSLSSSFTEPISFTCVI